MLKLDTKENEKKQNKNSFNGLSLVLNCRQWILVKREKTVS